MSLAPIMIINDFSFMILVKNPHLLNVDENTYPLTLTNAMPENNLNQD